MSSSRDYVHAVGGASGGMANVLLMHPFDTVKTRLQVRRETASQGESTFRVMRSVVRGEGIGGLYRGVVPALFGGTVSWAFYFYWFNYCKAEFRNMGFEGMLANFTAGTSAGIVTAIATNPIWVVKTRLQLQMTCNPTASGAGQSNPAYRGFVHGVRYALREEGLRGLYRGLGPSLWLVSHGAFQFAAYEAIKSWMLSSDVSQYPALTIYQSLCASTTSKLFAATVTYPLQVVRTNMQQRGVDKRLHGSFFTSARTLYREQGFLAFYRGITANFIRVAPSAAITFVTYEQVVQRLRAA